MCEKCDILAVLEKKYGDNFNGEIPETDPDLLRLIDLEPRLAEKLAKDPDEDSPNVWATALRTAFADSPIFEETDPDEDFILQDDDSTSWDFEVKFRSAGSLDFHNKIQGEVTEPLRVEDGRLIIVLGSSQFDLDLYDVEWVAFRPVLD